MAYDEELAHRLRELLADEPDLTEKRMFGGLAFLIGGNMALSASGRGGLMVRTNPATSRELIATTHARPIEMRGREMPGWLHLSASDVRSTRELVSWVDIARNYTRSLPSKKT